MVEEGSETYAKKKEGMGLVPYSSMSHRAAFA